MAAPFDYENGVPVWRAGMTDEEKRQYRKAKHRVHAARSRRLRGKEHPDRTPRGERQEYTGSAAADAPDKVKKKHPKVGDYDGDGVV